MNFRRRQRLPSEVSKDSLNDIMFFLLLFFLITSSLVNPNILKVNNPKGTNRSIVHDNVTVTIDEKRSFYVNKNKTEEANLAASVGVALDKLKEKDAVLIINADKSVPVDDVVKVMNLAKKKNVKVVLQTQP